MLTIMLVVIAFELALVLFLMGYYVRMFFKLRSISIEGWRQADFVAQEITGAIDKSNNLLWKIEENTKIVSDVSEDILKELRDVRERELRDIIRVRTGGQAVK